MSVSATEGQQPQPEFDSGKDNMYRPMTALVEPIKKSLKPQVNIDAENYLIRELGRSSLATPSRVTDLVASPVDGIDVCDIVKSPIEESNTEPTEITQPEVITVETTSDGTIITEITMCTTANNTDFFCGINSQIFGTTTPSTNGCARVLSFHHILCSCESSCCCNCGISCSIDCHSCFHNYCSRFFNNYICQKDNDTLPPVTLDYDRVSCSII